MNNDNLVDVFLDRVDKWINENKLNFIGKKFDKVEEILNLLPEDMSELSIYRKLKLKQPDSSQTSMPIKKNVTWENELEQQQPKQISLVIEEIPPNKVDILIDKVDILIDLMTKLTNTLTR